MNKFYKKFGYQESLEDRRTRQPLDDFTDRELSWLLQNLNFYKPLKKTQKMDYQHIQDFSICLYHFVDKDRENTDSISMAPTADNLQRTNLGPQFSLYGYLQIFYHDSTKLDLPASIEREFKEYRVVDYKGLEELNLPRLSGLILKTKIDKRKDDWFIVSYSLEYKIYSRESGNLIKAIYNDQGEKTSDFLGYYKCDGFRGLRMFLQDYEFIK